MKKTIASFFVLLALLSRAQFNNTYDVNLNSDYLTPSFVIMTSDKGSVSLSYGSDAPSSPSTDYFILTKNNAGGGVVFNRRIDPSNTPKDGLIQVKALLETKDKGILVAGYIYNLSSKYEQPFLFKVDINGNLLWEQTYLINKTNVVGIQFNKISLARVADDVKETYFIVTAANSDKDPVNDVATNVIKVDDKGNMLWSKKYYDTSVSPYAPLREYPGDIEFSPSDKLYMITGWRQQWLTVQEDRMYFFGIDHDGLVVTDYKSITAEGYPFGQDMIWDPNTKRFAVSFTHGNSSYIPGVASGIGLVTLDAGLNLFIRNFYWHKDGLENYGSSISLCANGDYAIGCFVYDNGLAVHNPAWLRVDNAGNPLAFVRYNVKDDVVFGHHCTAVNPSTGNEEFVLIGLHKTDLRVIRTAAGGEACGAKKYEPFVKEFKPKEELFKYDYKASGKYTKYVALQKKIDPPYRKCDGDGTSYRTMQSGIEGVDSDENSLLLYPSVISADNARVTVVNNYAATLQVEVRSLTGQLVYTGSLAPGDNSVQLNKNSSLSEGLYLVKVSAANGSLVSSKKLLITK